MEKQNMDETDRRILNKMAELQTVRHASIAKELGIPNATVNKRINRMANCGVIEGFVPVVNLRKLGYNVTAIINVRLKYETAIDSIAEFAKEQNVCAVYKVTGPYDVAVIAKFKSTDELDLFTEKYLRSKAIARTNTSLVFSAKKEGQIPNVIL